MILYVCYMYVLSPNALVSYPPTLLPIVLYVLIITITITIILIIMQGMEALSGEEEAEAPKKQFGSSNKFSRAA
jgi:hypothetical protein